MAARAEWAYAGGMDKVKRGAKVFGVGVLLWVLALVLIAVASPEVGDDGNQIGYTIALGVLAVATFGSIAAGLGLMAYGYATRNRTTA